MFLIFSWPCYGYLKHRLHAQEDAAVWFSSSRSKRPSPASSPSCLSFFLSFFFFGVGWGSEQCPRSWICHRSQRGRIRPALVSLRGMEQICWTSPGFSSAPKSPKSQRAPRRVDLRGPRHRSLAGQDLARRKLREEHDKEIEKTKEGLKEKAGMSLTRALRQTYSQLPSGAFFFKEGIPLKVNQPKKGALVSPRPLGILVLPVLSFGPPGVQPPGWLGIVVVGGGDGHLLRRAVFFFFFFVARFPSLVVLKEGFMTTGHMFPRFFQGGFAFSDSFWRVRCQTSTGCCNPPFAFLFGCPFRSLASENQETTFCRGWVSSI